MASILQRMFRKLKYGDPIVVVSGLPRSGTSMCMKMLDAAGIPVVQDGIRSADEDNPKGYFEMERVKDLDKPGDKSWVKQARGHSLKVISFLLPDLPTDNFYKVLFIHRDYREILASQAKMLERRGESSDTPDDRMIELYDGHLRKVKGLLSHEACFDSLELHYRDFIDDPATQAARIDEFLGGGHDVAKMAAAVDSKLYRNRAEGDKT